MRQPLLGGGETWPDCHEIEHGGTTRWEALDGQRVALCTETDCGYARDTIANRKNTTRLVYSTEQIRRSERAMAGVCVCVCDGEQYARLLYCPLVCSLGLVNTPRRKRTPCRLRSNHTKTHTARKEKKNQLRSYWKQRGSQELRAPFVQGQEQLWHATLAQFNTFADDTQILYGIRESMGCCNVCLPSAPRTVDGCQSWSSEEASLFGFREILT